MYIAYYMELLPIKEHLFENTDFNNRTECTENLQQCTDFYKRVGFNPPWICYFVQMEGQLVAGAAFKGKPLNHKVEIAYGVFEKFQNKGIGNRIAKVLVQLALDNDPTLRITAQTLKEENYSVRILRKNNFVLIGTAIDDDEGEVWEWEYQKV